MSDDAGRAEGKPPHLDRLSALWRRLNDHKIVQWSVAYVALAYAIQHAIILTSESLEWPNAVARVSMLLLALGLPLVVTFAWYHGARASRNFSQAELSILAALLVTSSLLFYVFVRPAEQAAAPAAAQQAGVAAARNAAISPATALSIAVLPFANLSGDAAQEFFSDGITEEIASALAKVPKLQVVGRISTFQFKGQNKDLGAIRKALGARFLIDGSVRKVGERVRITAQLIQAENGLNVWTENYDRQLTDIFAIQEEIAQAIATSLRVPLGLQQGERLVSNRDIDPDSYQQYLRAKALIRNRDFNPLTTASALLEQVVARHPDYAPAWALLALAYDLTPQASPAWLAGSASELRDVVNATQPKAEAAAQRAVQLDANLAEGYAALALVQQRGGKLVLAEETFGKSLALDPNSPDLLQAYSNFLAAVGRPKEALAMKDRLHAQEPLVPVFTATTAIAQWLNGDDKTAEALTKGLPPSFRGFQLATFYSAAGRYGDAADALREIPSGFYPPGPIEAAARVLRAAPAKTASTQIGNAGYLAFVYLYVGAPERALEPRERDVEAGYFQAIGFAVAWHPTYASARKTERFKALVRKIGLVEYWKAKGWPNLCHPTTGDDFACA